jgi:hypothetical protein
VQPHSGLTDLSVAPKLKVEDDRSRSPEALHDAILEEDYLHMAQELSGWYENESKPVVLTPLRNHDVVMKQG